MITHIVLMTFHDKDDVDEAVSRLKGMEGRIEGLRALEVGRHNGLDPRGADLGLITRHDDLDGLRAYGEHPQHREVVAWLKPRLAGVQIVDF